MKITPFKDISLPTKNVSSTEKSFYKLSEGEIFKAQITDIQHGKVMLKLNDGFSIEAKLQNQMLEMKIGQIIFFKVQSNSNDQILIEILKNQHEDPKLNVVLDALNAAKLIVNSENVKLVENLLENHLPIDSNSLREIFHQIKNHPDISLEEILFLLKNEIQIDEKNILQLNGYIEHNKNLEEQVNQLLDKIENMEDSSHKLNFIKSLTQTKQIRQSFDIPLDFDAVDYATFDLLLLEKEIEILTFLKDKPESLLKSMLQQDYSTLLLHEEFNEEIRAMLSGDKELFDFFKNTLKLLFETNKGKDSLDRILSNKVKEFLNIIRNDIHITLEDFRDQNSLKAVFNKLYKYALSIDEIANKMESPQGKEIAAASEQIKDNLDFMNQLNKYQSYIQIPIRINHHYSQADLYVFRKKKNKKNDAHSISALIALDFANLGYIESFVQKNGKDIYCQFRLENENLKELFQKYTHNLMNALHNKGYYLKSISFHPLKERFNIIKSPENDSNIKEEPKRYSFDMRV